MKELSAITKCYDLALWLIPALDKFPRNRRFSLGEKMECEVLELLDLLIEAKYRRSKTAQLTEANLKLEKLRFMSRMAKDLDCLPIKGYEHFNRQMNGLGIEVGGWLKQQRSK